jgi:hypothetical protein
LGLVGAIRGDETHRRDHKDDEGFKGHGLGPRLDLHYAIAGGVKIRAARIERVNLKVDDIEHGTRQRDCVRQRVGAGDMVAAQVRADTERFDNFVCHDRCSVLLLLNPLMNPQTYLVNIKNVTEREKRALASAAQV